MGKKMIYLRDALSLTEHTWIKGRRNCFVEAFRERNKKFCVERFVVA